MSPKKWTRSSTNWSHDSKLSRMQYQSISNPILGPFSINTILPDKLQGILNGSWSKYYSIPGKILTILSTDFREYRKVICLNQA